MVICSLLHDLKLSSTVEEMNTLMFFDIFKSYYLFIMLLTMFYYPSSLGEQNNQILCIFHGTMRKDGDKDAGFFPHGDKGSYVTIMLGT